MNLQKFDVTTLDEMGRVALLKRVDTKFRFHRDHLQHILDSVQSEYRILEIEGSRSSSYQTTYLDTADNAMYLSHHNGKAHRYKVRTRTYLHTDQHFVEVKLKNNRGITKKTRQPRLSAHQNLTHEESAFIDANSPYSAEQLHKKLSSQFNRITLVDLIRNERITIDVDVTFSSDSKEFTLSDIVIAEIKSSGRPSDSPFYQALRAHKIYPARFSKYCLGRALLEPDLKQNRFKERLLSLTKLSPNLQTL